MRHEKMQLTSIDVNIASLELDSALVELARLINLDKNRYICFLEANLLSLAVPGQKLQNVLREADIVFPDGVVLSLLNRIKGNRKIQCISGPSFMLKACEYGQQFGWKHFFYGGSEGIPEKLAENLKAKYPDMIVAGTYSPPFRDLSDEEELKVKKLIEDSGTDLLWVGLGGPKQEFWMADHVGKINVPVMLGVGAAFDFHSGNRPWAPKIVRKLRLEWLFRTFTGGRKTFKRNIICISKIAVILVKEILLKFSSNSEEI